MMVYDPSHSGAVQVRYFYGPAGDAPLAESLGQAHANWLLADHQGSVRSSASPVLIAGTWTGLFSQCAYDAYGNISDVSGLNSPLSRFGYTGQEFDSESGLYYYNARYYDPKAGRFVNQDPKGFDAGDGNLYRYVGNNPLNLVDPTGLGAESTAFKMFRAAACSLTPTDQMVEAVRAYDPAWGAKLDKWMPYSTTHAAINSIAADIETVSARPSAVVEPGNVFRASGALMVDNVTLQNVLPWGHLMPKTSDSLLAPSDPVDRAAYDLNKVGQPLVATALLAGAPKVGAWAGRTSIPLLVEGSEPVRVSLSPLAEPKMLGPLAAEGNLARLTALESVRPAAVLAGGEFLGVEFKNASFLQPKPGAWQQMLIDADASGWGVPKAASADNAAGRALYARGKFRTGTVDDAVSQAPHNATGEMICPTCEEAIPATRVVQTKNGPVVRRGFDLDHFPDTWAERVARMKQEQVSPTRKAVLDEYNKRLRVQCPECNQSHEYEGVPGVGQ